MLTVVDRCLAARWAKFAELIHNFERIVLTVFAIFIIFKLVIPDQKEILRFLRVRTVILPVYCVF